MGEILLIGNLFMVTNHFVEHLYKDKRIILCGNTPVKEYKNRKVVPYSFREDDQEYKGIFKSYSLDTVIYFSKVLDGQKRLYDEIEQLENALYCSETGAVKQFIYVTTNDYVKEIQEPTTRTGLLQTCENICRKFSNIKDMDVLVVRIPWVFSEEPMGSRIEQVLIRAEEQREMVLAGARTDETDFICDSDLAELLSRVVDEPVKGFCATNISGGNPMSFSSLSQKIKVLFPEANTIYKEYSEAVPVMIGDDLMRETYGWFPIGLLEDSMEAMLEAVQRKKSQKKKRRQWVNLGEGIKKNLLIAVEMIFLFVCSEILTDKVSMYARIDYVDFRLLFVGIMGIMHGIGAGIIASILASVGYFAKDIAGSNLQIIFFNIVNWLPFATYFVSGTIVGHICDKNRETISFFKKEISILENKYIFLNELYGKTLENKEEFSRQIVGYQDSFGKIYQIVRKLNSTEPDNIFREAVISLEEMLEVTSVSIYSVQKKSSYGRLNVCSRESNGILTKSIDLSQIPEVLDAMRAEKSWYNAEGKEGYPPYAAPIFKDGQMIGMILLWQIKSSQMKMEFYNRFNIICGLVQDALVRAIAYSEREESRMMFPETRIMKPEHFEQIIENKVKLSKEGMSDYVLLRLKVNGITQIQLSEAVSSSIRGEDTLGKRQDGNIYLLLAQADKKSVGLVEKRLNPKGIELEQTYDYMD